MVTHQKFSICHLTFLICYFLGIGIKRGLHVWLVRSGRRIEDFAEQMLCMIIVAAVKGYSLVDVNNCLVHVFYCFHAMATPLLASAACSCALACCRLVRAAFI
jgi:hypothetical protein